MDFLLHTKIDQGERLLDRRRMYQTTSHATGACDADSFLVEMRGGEEPPVVRRWDCVAQHFSVHHGLSSSDEERVVWLVRKMWQMAE